MGILDQITKMKGQGIPDEEILNELAQQGISPREINEALKQAQIKYAVSDEREEMQPSVMPEREMSNQQQTYAPENYEQQYAAPVPEEYYQPQEQQPQSGEYANEYASSGMNTDMVMEIADQIFSDKIRKIQKQVDATSEAAIILQTRNENILERLKKIESTIDKLQIAILEKVGSYGQNLEGIKKEMSMMQDSFSKMISPSKEPRRLKESSFEEPEESKKISRKK